MFPLILLLLGVLLACLGAAVRRHRRRLAERERATAAVQDALLQAMQGLILRFQSVGHRLPEGSAERAAIDAILDQADEALAEARNRMAALR
ncbi:hypothetical protein [Duganella violaceipulchra]|uniref:Signal transduction histidine kinase n=1 Tax=Duganella violaceipulchra TaxID=2849652 RepID=A0AA41H7Y7_9BURK|nr:hypothetical protein [Duganella violaceicalia]MBV6322259.1 hypothetical protein [Duganella violaceicalia]MCP2011406.1 signal transduction histidine kinase [Duganella violaceicalia]